MMRLWNKIRVYIANKHLKSVNNLITELRSKPMIVTDEMRQRAEELRNNRYKTEIKKW